MWNSSYKFIIINACDYGRVSVILMTSMGINDHQCVSSVTHLISAVILAVPSPVWEPWGQAASRSAQGAAVKSNEAKCPKNTRTLQTLVLKSAGLLCIWVSSHSISVHFLFGPGSVSLLYGFPLLAFGDSWRPGGGKSVSVRRLSVTSTLSLSLSLLDTRNHCGSDHHRHQPAVLVVYRISANLWEVCESYSL